MIDEADIDGGECVQFMEAAFPSTTHFSPLYLLTDGEIDEEEVLYNRIDKDDGIIILLYMRWFQGHPFVKLFIV